MNSGQTIGGIRVRVRSSSAFLMIFVCAVVAIFGLVGTRPTFVAEAEAADAAPYSVGGLVTKIDGPASFRGRNVYWYSEDQIPVAISSPEYFQLAPASAADQGYRYGLQLSAKS